MRQSITMRLDPSILSAAKLRAKAHNLSLSRYVEMLLMRDLVAYDENTEITVFARDGLPTEYEVMRDRGESDASYEERKEALKRL